MVTSRSPGVALIVGSMLVASAAVLAMADDQAPPPVQVFVTKDGLPPHVRYKYRVVNGSAFPITSLLVGFGCVQRQPELRMFDDETPSGNDASPPGWRFYLQPTEEDSVGNVIWDVDSTGKAAILGGRELAGFTLDRPQEDTAYVSVDWTVFLGTGPHSCYSGTLETDPRAPAPPSSVFARNGVRLTPNPARTRVTIGFTVPAEGATAVEIFDAAGLSVTHLVNGTLSRGAHTVTWNGLDPAGQRVRPGTYFVRVKTSATERFGRLRWVK